MIWVCHGVSLSTEPRIMGCIWVYHWSQLQIQTALCWLGCHTPHRHCRDWLRQSHLHNGRPALPTSAAESSLCDATWAVKWNIWNRLTYVFCNILQWTALLRLFVLMFYHVLPFYICIVMYLMMWYHVEICGIDWHRLTIVHEMQDLFPTRHLHHIGRTPQALGSSGLARHGAWMVPGEWVDPLFWRRISISISKNVNHIIFGIFWTCHVHLCE